MLVDAAAELVIPEPAQELRRVSEAGQPHSHVERASANVRSRRRGIAEDFVDEGFADYCEHRLNLAFRRGLNPAADKSRRRRYRKRRML
ncbi:hypothetical protein GCM10027404_24340 [Arthrobacter tumbae]